MVPRERHVAAVAGVGVDDECVALGDGPGEVELRVLIPTAAAVEVGVRGECDQEEPFGNAAVRAAHRRGLYVYDSSTACSSRHPGRPHVGWLPKYSPWSFSPPPLSPSSALGATFASPWTHAP